MLTPPVGININDYINAIRQGNPTHARITFLTQNIVFDDNNIAIEGITIRTIGNNENYFRLGSVASSELTVNFINSDAFDTLDWTQECKLEFGVEMSGVTQWVTVGYYTGKKPRKIIKSKLIVYTAKDRMNRFNAIADDFLATYNTGSKRIRDFFEELCQYVGLTGDFDLDYPYGQNIPLIYIYPKKIFQSGVTCKQLLTWIAEATGKIAHINQNGEVTLSLCNWTSITTIFYEDSCYEIDINDDLIPQKDSIILSKSQDADYNYFYPTTGTNPYRIIDNPILLNMNDTNKNNAINYIVSRPFDKIGSYKNANVTIEANWMYEVGDSVNVGYVENGVSKTTGEEIIFNRTFHWNGHCVDEWEFPGSVDEDDYYTQSVKEQLSLGGKLSELSLNLSEIIDNNDSIYKFGQGLADNTDFNTVIIPGYYRVETDANALTMSNCPLGRAGCLHVEVANKLDTSTRVFQKYRTVSSNNEYSRSLTSNGWTSWVSLTDQLGGRTFYTTVTQLGLTAGSATILNIWNAMTYDSELMVKTSELASGEQPPVVGDAGVLVIRKIGNGRAIIQSWTKANSAFATMGTFATTYNGNDANKPSGVWLVRREEFYIDGGPGTVCKIVYPATSTHLLMIAGDSSTRNYIGIVTVLSSGNVNVVDIVKGSQITVSTSNKTVTITSSNTNYWHVNNKVLRGSYYNPNVTITTP